MFDTREIDAARARPGFTLGLSGVLEGQFDNHVEKPARRQITAVLAVTLVLVILGLFSDANAGILQQALLWKAGVQIPALVLGLLALTRPSLASGRIWLAGALPLNVVMAVTMVLAMQTQSR